MCFQFKEKHLYDVDTAYHNIILYRERKAPAPKQEICIRHENMNYDWYCYSCELPACIRCADHRNHDIVTLGTAYITQQEKHKKRVHIMRKETDLIFRTLIANVTTLGSEKANRQSIIEERAKKTQRYP